MKVLAVLVLFSLPFAQAETLMVSCEKTHSQAISACAAHEHSLSANALTIVSLATRERVIKREEEKLEGLKSRCLKTQEACALTCDEEVETASLDGADLSRPLDHLTDCRQGTVAQHLRTMDKKLSDLRRVLNVKPDDIKNASYRTTD